jgi:hypothetical protein
MTRLTLPDPAGRALALAILVAALWLIYATAVAPVLALYADAAATTEQREQALERYRRVGAGLEALQAELAAARQRQTAGGIFLRGASDTLIGADIQNRVKTLLGAAHADLSSAQLLPVQQEGVLRRIAMRGQMTVTLAAAQQLFHALEGGEPLLFLDNVDIRPHAAARRGGVPVEDGLLDIHFDVYGYAQTGPP